MITLISAGWQESVSVYMMFRVNFLNGRITNMLIILSTIKPEKGHIFSKVHFSFHQNIKFLKMYNPLSLHINFPNFSLFAIFSIKKLLSKTSQIKKICFVILGTLFIDIDNINCFGTGLPIAVSPYIYISIAILSFNCKLTLQLFEMKPKSEENVHFYLTFLQFSTRF